MKHLNHNSILMPSLFSSNSKKSNNIYTNSINLSPISKDKCFFTLNNNSNQLFKKIFLSTKLSISSIATLLDGMKSKKENISCLALYNVSILLPKSMEPYKSKLFTSLIKQVLTRKSTLPNTWNNSRNSVTCIKRKWKSKDSIKSKESSKSLNKSCQKILFFLKNPSLLNWWYLLTLFSLNLKKFLSHHK